MKPENSSMSVRLNVLVKNWIALLKEPEKLAIEE